jgi:hypothetical protein
MTQLVTLAMVLLIIICLEFCHFILEKLSWLLFVNLKKSNSISKINNIYSKKNNKKDDKKHKKVLTIVFAESCPYTLPEQFVLNNDYKYICGSL